MSAIIAEGGYTWYSQPRATVSPRPWLIFLFLSALLYPSRASAGDNWPEFRGPLGNGHADATGLPVRWSETENIRWKTPIHDKGWSSPVIWGSQIWLTTATADGTQLFAVGIDRDTGKILHDIKVFDVEKPAFCHPFNSYASPTPVIEEGRVYVHFGSYGTACLDTASGRTLWSRRDLPCDHFRGPGSSPILYGNLLFIAFDGFDQQYVVALDKTTGRTVWKRDRDIDYGTTNGDLKKAYGTATVIKVDGTDQLVSPSAVATIAYDPATGQELWKVYHGGMNASARPLYGQGLLFISTGHPGAFRLFAMRPNGHGDITKSHVVWKLDRGVPLRPSLLLIEDLLYMVNETGVASCLEAQSGQRVWQQRLGKEYTASPMYADGRLYFFDQEGSGHVLQAGREAKVLANNRLDDGCMASPAVAGKALYVRTRTHLYRIEQGAEKPAGGGQSPRSVSASGSR
jgi:outer membrane protein assembly factor BamB